MLQAVCINDFLDDGKMRVKPLEDLMLSTWAKSASEDRLFRECSGISETKSDIKITCEITLRFFSPHPLLSGYVPRRAQINVNYDYYVMNLVRAFNLIRTLVEFKTYLFNVGGTMADTFGAISLSNMTQLFKKEAMSWEKQWSSMYVFPSPALAWSHATGSRNCFRLDE